MKQYCVVYRICGIHYRYRCSARNKKKAMNMCLENMGTDIEIVEVEIEE